MTETLEMRRFLAKLKRDVIPTLSPIPPQEEIASSHALTALTLSTVGGMPPDDTPLFVIDGSQDYGIDGLYFNAVTRTVYIVQSKLRRNQEKSVQQGDILKLLRGTDRILNGDISKANQKLHDAYDFVFEALEDINTRIVIIIACTSNKLPEPNIAAELDSFCRDRNQSDEIFSWRYLGFNELFQAAKLFSADLKTNVEIRIVALGRISSPYHSYFGAVPGAQIADWVNQFGERLFDQNVRSTLHKSTVNDEILETLRTEPKKFWYFNNGITAIAASAKPAPAEGDTRKIVAESMSIVNGAQTAGMLARAVNDGIDLSAVSVQFRVISLADAEAGLDDQITKANNTQNALNPLDFVSLDPQQGIISDELAGLGYAYSYKRGSETLASNPRIEVKDAAIALACSQSALGLTAQAKRYVSGLWSDIRTTPYTLLFNSATTGAAVLNAWSVLKTCEKVSRELRQPADAEDTAILTHSEKFLTHCTLDVVRRRSVYHRDDDAVGQIARAVAERIMSQYKARPGKTVPPSDFKNVRTLEPLKEELDLNSI